MAKAEKFFRELASLPLSVFTTQKSDFERMKKMARDLGKKWAEQRRQEILYEEIMQIKKAGGGHSKKRFTANQSSLLNESFEKQTRISEKKGNF